MKHKCVWETTGNSTRCVLCGVKKHKTVIDKQALSEYQKIWYKKQKKGARI